MVEYEPGRWIKILFRVNGSVLPRIVWRVISAFLVACALTYIERAIGFDLPNSVRLHMVVGVALGLLLVFRTNASYERFWEGRIQVGDMVSQSRDLARKTAAVYHAVLERRSLSDERFASLAGITIPS